MQRQHTPKPQAEDVVVVRLLARSLPQSDSDAVAPQDTATLTGGESLAAVLRRRCAAPQPSGAPAPPAPGAAAAERAAPGAASGGDAGAACAGFAVERGLADTALTGLAVSQAAQHREFAEQARSGCSIIHGLISYAMRPFFEGSWRRVAKGVLCVS